MAVSRSKKKAPPALTKPAPESPAPTESPVTAAEEALEPVVSVVAKDELALLKARVARLEAKLAKLIAAVPMAGSARRTL